MTRILVTRPQPGAAQTAERLVALGHDPVVAPLFTAEALNWVPPDDKPETLMLTSAAAARLGGAAMAPFFGLPCFCVGARTAAAARAAGFTDVRAPDARDGGELFEAIAAAGIRSVLHFSGREIAAYAPPQGVRLERRIVYAAVARNWTDAEHGAAADADLALVYSPRGATALVAALGADRGRIRMAAISRNAADAAGDGWAACAVADRPDEDALFAAAGLLCEKQAGDAPLTRTG